MGGGGGFGKQDDKKPDQPSSSNNSRIWSWLDYFCSYEPVEEIPHEYNHGRHGRGHLQNHLRAVRARQSSAPGSNQAFFLVKIISRFLIFELEICRRKTLRHKWRRQARDTMASSTVSCACPKNKVWKSNFECKKLLKNRQDFWRSGAATWSTWFGTSRSKRWTLPSATFTRTSSWKTSAKRSSSGRFSPVRQNLKIKNSILRIFWNTF